MALSRSCGASTARTRPRGCISASPPRLPGSWSARGERRGGRRGDGIAVAMRIESHNHPSAIEPYQGAATGVGGIVRDVFTMGARPIALMDPLFFGPLDEPRSRWLFEGVVRGISGYGNAVGVPTVGGEIVFDPCYAQPARQRVLPGGDAGRAAHARAGDGRREPGRAGRVIHRSGRHRRGQRAGVGRVRRGRRAMTGPSGPACRWATRSRRSASSRRASSCSTGVWPSACRTSGGRAHLRGQRDRVPGAWGWTCGCPRYLAASRA